jgi:phosphatidate cytidylyltransferase
MSSKTFLLRTATVVLGLPVFFTLVYLLPYFNHLVLNIGAVVVAAVGAAELQALFAKRGIRTFPYFFLLAALIPAVTYLEVAGLVNPTFSLALCTALAILVFIRSLWVKANADLSGLLQRVSASLLTLIYPAVLLSFIVRLTGFENARWVLIYFFSINFANDMSAYLAGMFLGRQTRLDYVISPNKSLVGFVAGILAAVGIALLFKAVMPRLLPLGYAGTVVFGAVCGLFTIGGDLVESAFKRSAEVKDSGGIIPGRGGILDNIDSWLFTAPLFYFVFLWFSR